MKVYVCGPITGKPELNETAFRIAAQQLKLLGHEPLVPHDIPPRKHEGECPVSYVAAQEGGHSAACYLREDIRAMLDCDAIFVLGYFSRSIGAGFEHYVAGMCGLPIYYTLPDVPDGREVQPFRLGEVS